MNIGRVLIVIALMLVSALLVNIINAYEVIKTKHFEVIIHNPSYDYCRKYYEKYHKPCKIPEELVQHVVNELERAYNIYVNELDLKITPPCVGTKYTIYCPCPSEVGSVIYLKIKNSHACVSKIILPLCPDSTKSALTDSIFHELAHAVQDAYNPHDYKRYRAVYENMACGFSYMYGFDKLFAFLNTFTCDTFIRSPEFNIPYMYRISAYDCGGFFTWLLLVKNMSAEEVLKESLVKKNFKYLDRLYDEYVDWVEDNFTRSIAVYLYFKVYSRVKEQYSVELRDSEIYIYLIPKILNRIPSLEKLLTISLMIEPTAREVITNFISEVKGRKIPIIKIPINELSIGTNHVNVSLLNGILNLNLTLVVNRNYTSSLMSSNELVLYEKLYVNDTPILSKEFVKLYFQPFMVIVNVDNDSLTFPAKFNKINELKVGAGNESLIIKFNITNPKMLINVNNDYSLTFKLRYEVDLIEPVKTSYEVKNEVFRVNMFEMFNYVVNIIFFKKSYP